MLKKLTLAGIAIIASSNIAFADDVTNYNSSDTAASVATAATGSDSESHSLDVDNVSVKESSAAVSHKAVVKPKKHHKKLHHHHHHHRALKPAPVVAEDYKNEGAVAEPTSQVSAAASEPTAEMTSCPACEHIALNQGPYLGFGVGSRVNNLLHNASYTGVEGTLFAGYSTIWQQMYAAFEVFAQNSATALDYRLPAASARSNWSYGASVMPGYLLTDQTVGYLRLGAVHTRFDSHSSNANGAQVGLGLQTALNNAWEVRGEWDYSFYKSIKVGALHAVPYNQTPHSQQFSVSMLYKLAM